MKPRLIVLSLAAVAIVGAVILLFLPVSTASLGGRGLECGSGFASGDLDALWNEQVTKSMQPGEGGTDFLAFLQQAQADGGYATTMDAYRGLCDDALTLRRGVGFGLGGVGILVLVGALVLWRPATKAGISSTPPTA
ncbi:hypothetical protein DMC63_01180 [Streptomyces sp. WAC 05977]|nr:hypothetical protein DMC63_01180 [Streptomyces sp. WAC 05977]